MRTTIFIKTIVTIAFLLTTKNATCQQLDTSLQQRPSGKIPSFNIISATPNTPTPTDTFTQLPQFKTDPNFYLLTKTQKQKRTKLVTGISVGSYAAAMVGLYAAWYKNYPQSSFKSFNDLNEWKGIDKIGHAYSAYAESKAAMELWRWAGVGKKKRVLYGGLSGAAYQTVIEVLDGYSAQWGWSWGDFAANCIGSGIIIGQELAWDEQRIQFKFSFNKKSYPTLTETNRANTIFGKSTAERFLKDYNAQTYWLSANLKSFFKKSNLPNWLNIAVGTGAEGLYGANNNIATDAQGNITFNGSHIKRYRQWYLAPDIDLSKIKTNKKGLKILYGILNIIKIPMPTLELSNGKLQLHAIYF
jgi:uncharacterized protein YfiM (DUF2279 family)